MEVFSLKFIYRENSFFANRGGGISNCYNVGNISASNNTDSGKAYIGGLLGYNSLHLNLAHNLLFKTKKPTTFRSSAFYSVVS